MSRKVLLIFVVLVIAMTTTLWAWSRVDQRRYMRKIYDWILEMHQLDKAHALGTFTIDGETFEMTQAQKDSIKAKWNARVDSVKLYADSLEHAP